MNILNSCRGDSQGRFLLNSHSPLSEPESCSFMMASGVKNVGEIHREK